MTKEEVKEELVLTKEKLEWYSDECHRLNFELLVSKLKEIEGGKKTKSPCMEAFYDNWEEEEEWEEEVIDRLSKF